MSEIWIEGGRALEGEITVQGSKNAVLPMMAASLLQEGRMIFHGCPRITDVLGMEQMLRSLGAKTQWQGHCLHLDCRDITQCEVSDQDAESMRSSVLLMGSMLARKGGIRISYPGGCRIGKRPIDLHLEIFQKMGACITEIKGGLCLCLTKPLQAVSFVFPFSSVGATENAILAAVGANGISYFGNCAIEPEVTHLCHLLTKMGAKIKGIGTRNLEIEGGRCLKPIEYQVPTDRIVAGTYLYAVAATRGCCTLHRAPVEEMQSVLQVYEKMGGQWEYIGGKLKANAALVRFPVKHLVTTSYPGFPTDMQSLLMPVLMTVEGSSCIQEDIFENRFQIISQLQRMGGTIWSDGKCAYIKGKTRLRGACVEACELRGGAALVIAGLLADGTTCIRNAHYIQRGYENMDKQLQRLGGRIQIRR